MTDIDKYKDEKGNVNWKAFYQAEIDDGEVCSGCRRYIYRISTPTGPQKCHSCKALDDNKDEVRHESMIRCPSCGHQTDIINDCSEAAEYDELEEGEHAVTCEKCELEFDIKTEISFTFTSPPFVGEKD